MYKRQDLYHADEVGSVYSHADRMVTRGCMPVKEHVSIEKGIDCWKNFGTHYFLERREIGIFNIGGAGSIKADGVEYLSLIHISIALDIRKYIAKK